VDFSNPAVRRGLLGAAGTVLVVAIIGAFTVDSGGSGGKVAANQRTTTTAALSPGETTALAGSDTTIAAASATTVKGATTTTAKATSTVPSAQVPNPGAAKPPAIGTYTYNVTSTGADNKPSHSTSTIKVATDPNKGSAVGRQATQADPSGAEVTYHELWASNGVTMPSVHISSAQASFDCAWQPPILEFKFPMTTGTTWSFDSTCSSTVQGTKVTLHQTGTVKVTGKALDKIGTVSVPTWILDVNLTSVITSAFFNQTITTTGTRHFSPERGILTYQNITATNNGQSTKSEQTLQDVTPKA
jgi:hypothetical protein